MPPPYHTSAVYYRGGTKTQDLSFAQKSQRWDPLRVVK